MNKKFTLYSSDGCHLCEEALLLCNGIVSLNDIEVIDIVDDEKLVELYGISIPVFERMSDGQKIFWPFTQQNIKELT